MPRQRPCCSKPLTPPTPHPELWSAIKAWAEQKAPPIAERFVPAESEARMPESWGVLPTDAQLQLTKWAPGLPFYDYLGLDLPGSIAVWQELCGQAEAGEFVGKKVMRLGQDEPIERQYWSEGWVPVARDAEGNLLVIDLAPRPNGIRGQFVSWSRQEGPLSVLSSSITPWLRNYLHEIRRERVRYDPRTESLIQSTL